MQNLQKSKIEELKHICLELDVKRLYVFGSVLSNSFGNNSDIDFLLSFAENLTIEEYTNNYFALQYKLRALFKRDIDIVMENTLSNPYFIENVNNTKELIYEA